MIWVPWTPGPERIRADTELFVSVTEFTARRARSLPGVFAYGLRLRAGWFAMDGAVGLFLWSQPSRLRGGSVSVWRDEASLRRFVRLPLHAEIVRRFRGRVGVKSTSWTQMSVHPAELKLASTRLLATPIG
ncbi:MAG TPA: hypothetical protein VFE65_25710 [Pseudonocardia sp.]|nr:hypothetical protein [Pseudonocardia sp.]